MIFRTIKPNDDTAVAELVRRNLKAHQLDIPGTVYFDENLYHLSDFYNALPDKRAYYVLVDEEDKVIGGVGIAEFEGIEDCAELQKLYLDDSVKGKGLSYNMMKKAEAAALERGYKRVYLETHNNLKAAIHLYEKCGYAEIDRPKSVVHSTMDRFFLKEL
ncbi:MAG: GNAT family N-acetyltransferase [Lachnospiraceae bacterium]|nr:GNAT family N-acetyltransferase [Lachnospiraceae bacterium]